MQVRDTVARPAHCETHGEPAAEYEQAAGKGGDDGQLHEATWDEALAAVAKGLHGIRDAYGADALGFISSSRCTGEENYLVQKLSRAAFGTNNCHQCAAT